MRTKCARTLLLMNVLALGAGAARADELVYVGAGVLWSKISEVSATGSDLSNTAWKALAGFRPIKPFAVEADYLDLGSKSASFVGGNTDLQYKAFAAYAVGFLPLPVPFLDVFAKGGLARWSSSGGTTFPSGFTSLSDNGTEFAWGIGTQAHFGNLGARLEYETFHIQNTNGANAISLAVTVSFL
jgi:outer membrane protein with beta-barrel domain